MVSGLCIRSEIKRAPDTSPEYEGVGTYLHLIKSFSRILFDLCPVELDGVRAMYTK